MKGNMAHTVDIINLGCSKNLVDSENLLTQLSSRGMKVRIDPEKVDADILIINTCGFIHDAKEESVNTILQAIEARKSGRIHEIRVMGCLVQRYAADLADHIPEIDKWYGVNDFNQIMGDFSYTIDPDVLLQRLHSTPRHYAYLKVSEGCNRNCAFCSIPAIRGKHFSRPIEDLVQEARFLVANGVHELILIAQDLTYYGKDLYKEQKITQLVQELEKIEDLSWIRLHYAYPAQFPLELLDVMKDSKKVCKYIDIPLQHITDRMLNLMNRGISREETEKLINLIRTNIPGVSIRTTMLVGFPGETEEDFNQLLDFVRKSRFERLGVFTYSHEEGTTAGDEMKDSISEKVKKDRADQLMDVQQLIAADLNQKSVGKTVNVMIDRYEGGLYYGRTEADSPEVDQEVMIAARPETMQTGKIYNIRITDASEFDLAGVAIFE